jgi:HAD superfamily hydrolase (TIGR01490 family)
VWQFIYAQAKFQLTGRENSDDVAEGRRKALAFIEGRNTAELRTLGEEIYDEIIADKIWPGTRALTQMHLDAGQQVWLVTATPYELAETIARRLGLTGALGTMAESVDGVFTGRLVGDILHGLGKAHAVRALAIREGLNLKRCTAYSDSFNDVPMLSLVGTAVAINPDADLRELAREKGWEIKDFRTARKAAKIGLVLTIVLGALFTAVQVYEYDHILHEKLFFSEDAANAGLYGSAFMMATGFHGFHVLVGTIFLAVCLIRLLNGAFTPKQHFGFEAAAWYWHFVDVVWLGLYFLVYWL